MGLNKLVSQFIRWQAIRVSNLDLFWVDVHFPYVNSLMTDEIFSTAPVIL